MAKTRGDRISALTKELEAIAKNVRAEIRKTASKSGLPKRLERAAMQLRKRAAAVAGHIEHYVHEIRMELERGVKKPAKKVKKAAKRVKAAVKPVIAPVNL